MSPVKDQDGCGSCWAFAAVGATEAKYNIERNTTWQTADLSEQNLVSSCCNAGSCDGGNKNAALLHIKNSGIVDEACFPYQSQQCWLWNATQKKHYCASQCSSGSTCANPPNCATCTGGTLWKIKDFHVIKFTKQEMTDPSTGQKWITTNMINKVKRALVCHGPLAICSGIWNHCVVLVGWNDATGSWIFKNSYGANWGNNGYGEIPYVNHPHSDFIWYLPSYADGVFRPGVHIAPPVPTPTPTPTVVRQLEIGDLKGPKWTEYIGKVVTVEGIFVRDPLPMLVTDLDIVRVNMLMPDDQYILLIGAESAEIDPREYGGAKLRLIGLVQAVDDESKYGDEYVAIQSISYEMLERVRIYCPEPIPMEIPTRAEVVQPRRYAILFGGGIDPVNNHERYWNDLKFMYSTLINEYGYTNNTIAVLYADGKGRDKDMPVHYSATQANLQTVFNLLRGITTTEDFIFVFMTNHGGGFKKDDLSKPLTSSGKFTGRFDADGDEGAESLDEKKYNRDLNGDGNITGQVSWDEELCGWKESIFDDTFQTVLANLKYDRMVIVMGQCFSGGLIADMAGSNRIIMSAAGEYEPSYAMDPYPYNTYDEFSYYFTCAINGADPDGKTVNADANGDGEVSMVEAFNYARAKDTQNETPWYEDSGDGIPHSGNMPAGGDGTLGSNTSLE